MTQALAPLWVAKLSISDPTAQKITHVHGITPDEVRQALIGQRGLLGQIDDDPTEGRRYYVHLKVRGRRVRAVLRRSPHDIDAWALATIYGF